MTRARDGAALGRRRLVSTALLLGVAAALVAGLLGALGTAHSQELGWDFRVAYLSGAEAVVKGASPYPDSLEGVDVPRLYAYPPQLAFVLTPFTALPEDVAVALVVLLSLAALMGALALVGVRDLRCYAVVVLWLPGWNALQLANISAALVLLVACAWRFRATVWPLAGALAAAISLKLFLWPLLVWGVATRRLRATALSVGIGLVGTAAAWAAIGFAGLETYPDLLSTIAEQESYSITGMMEELGYGQGVARLVAFGAGSALLALCVTFARRSDDERAFIVALAAALALSPIVWLHYLVLLIVPLGLRRPDFSALWLLPIVLWVCPRSENGDGFQPFVPALVAAAMLALVLIDRRESPVLRDASVRAPLP